MRRLLACVMCSVLVLTGALVAQQPNEPATSDEVRKLFDIMHSQQQVMALFDVVKQQSRALVPQILEKQLPNATPEEKAKMEEFLNGMYQKMFDSMPLQQMLDAMIPAYQHHFTHEDVEQLTQFYSSPIGQKLLTQLPAIMSEAMQAETPILQKWMSDQMSEIQKSAAEFARNLRNEKQKSKAPKQNPS